jgi:hypothetical protein
MHYSPNFMKNHCWLLLKLLIIEKIFGFVDVSSNYIIDDTSSKHSNSDGKFSRIFKNY